MAIDSDPNLSLERRTVSIKLIRHVEDDLRQLIDMSADDGFDGEGVTAKTVARESRRVGSTNR
jgi:hypothetical protein